MKSTHKIIQIFVLSLLSNCGAKNIADCDQPTAGVPCAARTKDEDARIALDKGDLETAVKLLKELVEANPSDYSRYPLLSAALAGRAGFDIFNVLRGNFGSNTSLLQTMGEFLPTPTSKGDAYASSLTDMSDAVSTLLSIPAALRAEITTDKYASSCALQITLYQSAYSIMLINQFAYSASGYDPTKLATMTAADAELILKNLLAAGTVTTGQNGEAANAAVAKAYAAIQAQPGETDQEKIASYVQSSH